MIIDLKNLKLQIKDKENFSLQKELSEKLLGTIEGRFLKPCLVQLTVERTGKLYLAKGKISTEIEVPCYRCLTNVAYGVNNTLVFTLAESSHEPDFSGEDDIIYFLNPEVDITPIVVETILVNLPMRILCKADCKGICTECGVDKNTEACNCKVDNIDPRLAKLKDLL